MAEGGLSVLVLGGSGRGNERSTNRGSFELFHFRENLHTCVCTHTHKSCICTLNSSTRTNSNKWNSNLSCIQNILFFIQHKYYAILSDLPTCQQLRKKVLFYYQKLSSVPVTQLRRKSLQVLRFSHHLVRLFVKKLKGLHKKNIFSILLLAIILLPLKYPIWLNSKVSQISHFLQQINK